VRALVIGGSVGGLFAALQLRRIGWDVAVFEKTEGDLAGRGAGIGLSVELFAAMRQVGVRVSAGTGVPHSSLLWLDKSGTVVCDIKRFWVTGAWSLIYRAVRAAVPDAIIAPGRTLERVAQEGARVTALFADGTRETGDLLVAADGVHSTVRRQYLPDIEPRYAGYVAWRGVVEERDLPPAAHALLMDAIAFVFPEREALLAMAMTGEGDNVQPGHRRFYFIWYRPVADAHALRDMFTDAAGRFHGLAIPPPLIRADVIAAMKDAARALLPAMLAAVVAGTARPLLQAITDMEVKQLVFGRAALLGDAAFVARPHVAAGITKAALDAAALADALAAERDIDRALARYDRERRDYGAALVAYSRYLGSTSMAPSPGRDPERVMREYGAPHLLHDADPGAGP
jgi:2-polyprenyl-6-methoxyphenol hydroxylase-like FAD-dependent oxidoreductase